MFYVPGQDVQRPTHQRLHIRDARDAQTVLEAVRLGVLQLVTRRLNETERAAYIRSGSLFVWEESDDELGLKRWTDGRFWSQSRMREPFLFYEERVPERVPNEPRLRPGADPDSLRFVDEAHAASPARGRPQGLVKQTYSAFVNHGGANARVRKWHLTAYLTYADVNSLPTLDQDPTLRSVVIPAGVYRSGKARSRQLDVENAYAQSTRPGASSAPLTLTMPYAPQTPTTPWQAATATQHQLQRTATPGYPSGAAAFAAAAQASQAVPRGYPSSAAYAQYAAAQAQAAAQQGNVDPRQDRMTEDQRLIHMLNQRHIM